MSGGGSPQPRNLYAETADELKARTDLAPRVYATEAQFRPQYNSLDMAEFQRLLEGSEGGSYESPYTDVERGFRNSQTGEFRTEMPPAGAYGGDAFGSLRAAGKPSPWVPFERQVQKTRTVNTPATPGYLSLADTVAKRAAEIEARGLTTQRTADIEDVRTLGPKSLEAIQASDPRTAALIEEMTSQADNELNMGAQMDPAMLRTATQAVRSRHQGMLGGTGNAGDFNEALGVSEFANNLRQQRRQFAAGTVGLRQGVYGDGFNRVLGRPAAADPQGYIGAAAGISRASGPRLFGSQIDANDINDSNFNAANARRIAAANNNAAMASAGISAAAMLATKI